MSMRTSLGRAIHRVWPSARRSVVFPLRAASRGLRMPPGEFEPILETEQTDQRFLLERARRHGPVFKMLLNRNYTTCVVGHERGRRLITNHERDLPGMTVDLHPFCMHGALRGMPEETHRSYRRKLMQGIQATRLADHEDAVAVVLDDLVERLAAPARSGASLRKLLRHAAAQVFLSILYGARPGSRAAEALEAAFLRFGPDAPVATIGESHAAAFREVLSHVNDLAENERSLVGRLRAAGDLDETLLVNVAYLFEPSHFDVYSLWHWVLDHLGSDENVGASYRRAADRARYARAVVQETLRMQQSELLYRRVVRDIAFEGFLIPADTTVRVCLWEGHKDETVFPDPFAFRPERFLERSYDANAYAPFGLGPRHCLGSNLVLDLGTTFVMRVLEGHRVVATGPTSPVRGAYHWEPNPKRTVQLKRVPD